MQIPLPLIIAGIVLVIIIIWKYFDGNTLVKRKPVIKEQSTTTSSAAPTAKKKGSGFSFGTLIGWAAIVGVAYICYLTATSVVREMAKPRPQVVKDMRRWTVTAPIGKWSEAVFTPEWYHTECEYDDDKMVVMSVKGNTTNVFVATGINKPDIQHDTLRFMSASTNHSAEIRVKQWSQR
ncbi:MAG: hypothetical protein WCT19_00960 [Candidatus Paceibacterota bacterium]|jgi:hypothetical protein